MLGRVPHSPGSRLLRPLLHYHHWPLSSPPPPCDLPFALHQPQCGTHALERAPHALDSCLLQPLLHLHHRRHYWLLDFVLLFRLFLFFYFFPLYLLLFCLGFLGFSLPLHLRCNFVVETSASEDRTPFSSALDLDLTSIFLILTSFG